MRARLERRLVDAVVVRIVSRAEQVVEVVRRRADRDTAADVEILEEDPRVVGLSIGRGDLAPRRLVPDDRTDHVRPVIALVGVVAFGSDGNRVGDDLAMRGPGRELRTAVAAVAVVDEVATGVVRIDAQRRTRRVIGVGAAVGDGADLPEAAQAK